MPDGNCGGVTASDDVGDMTMTGDDGVESASSEATSLCCVPNAAVCCSKSAICALAGSMEDVESNAGAGSTMDELGDWLGDMIMYEDAFDSDGDVVTDENGEIDVFSSCHSESK